MNNMQICLPLIDLLSFVIMCSYAAAAMRPHNKMTRVMAREYREVLSRWDPNHTV